MMKLKITSEGKSFLTVVIGLVCIMTCCFTFQRCQQDDCVEPKNELKIVYSDAEYEGMLKHEITKRTQQAGVFEKSFFKMQGFPLWEKSKWVETKSGRMLVVPLLSSNRNKRFLVGVVGDNRIIPVITELPTENTQAKMIYSIANDVLYNSQEIKLPLIRLKSKSVEEDVERLLYGNAGSAEDLFKASHQGETYDPEASFGKMKICTRDTDGNSSGSLNTGGHAWLEVTDPSGTRNTFSLWSDTEGHEFYVNRELKDVISSSMSTDISYGDFQKILDWNSDPAHKDWGVGNTCAGYSVDVWNQITGDDLGFGAITTPEELAHYIETHKK